MTIDYQYFKQNPKKINIIFQSSYKKPKIKLQDVSLYPQKLRLARFSGKRKMQKKKKGKGYLAERKHKMNYRQGFAKYLTIMRQFYVTQTFEARRFFLQFFEIKLNIFFQLKFKSVGQSLKSVIIFFQLKRKIFIFEKRARAGVHSVKSRAS